MRRLLTGTCALLFAVPAGPRLADAHDLWSDGGAVPGWVKAQCCGTDDAHHLNADDVHVTGDGYRVAGYRGVIRLDKRLPSPDGEWWVFYRDYADGTQSGIYCFFGPEEGS